MSTNLSEESIRALCDEADERNSNAYAALCEADLSEEEFVAGLRKIIGADEATLAWVEAGGNLGGGS